MQIVEYEVPDTDYGEESFVEVVGIHFDKEKGHLFVDVRDADVNRGYYQYLFPAREDGDICRIIARAAGVQRIDCARESDHVTLVDVLDEVEGIEFSEECRGI